MIGVATAAVIVIAIVEGSSSILFPIEIALRMTDSLYLLGCSPQQMARFIFQKKKRSSQNSPQNNLKLPSRCLSLSFIPFFTLITLMFLRSNRC